MAIQELSKDELSVVSGGVSIDLGNLLTSLVGLVLAPVTSLLNTVGGLLNGLLNGLLGNLLGGLFGK